MAEVTQVGNYILQNSEKVDRALHGTINQSAAKIGGVIKEDGSYDDKALLAEYDRLGGLITNLKGSKVKTDSFYDFEKKKPFDKPKPILLFNVNGAWVEVVEGEPLPEIVKAVEVLEEAKKKAKKK